MPFLFLYKNKCESLVPDHPVILIDDVNGWSGTSGSHPTELRC